MKVCPSCGQTLADDSRFCTRCGTLVFAGRSTAGPASEELSMPTLWIMVALLLIALVFPPWETVDQPPEFLGFGFILKPPTSSLGKEGIISRLLLTVELVTIAVGGLYLAWLFRGRRKA